jgi:hypothetical protein
MGSSGQLHALVTLLSGMNPRDILYRRVGGTQKLARKVTLRVPGIKFNFPCRPASPAPPSSEEIINVK